MSKFLPMGYCQLGRAARMLDCEVDDLIHWGAIGAIKLCLRNPGSGIIRSGSSPLSPSTFQWDGTGFINPNPDPMYEQYKSIFLEAVKNEEAKISKYCSLFFDRQVLTRDLPKQFTLRDFEDAGGEFSFGGFWELTGVELIESEHESIKFPIFPYGSSRFLHGWIIREDHLDDNFSLSEQLWIMGPDLITLNNAINKGAELQNIFNNDEIAAQAREQENLIPIKPPRLSDSSLLASLGLMAMLLANSAKKYRYGDRPNASKIRESVIELAKGSLGKDEAKDLQLANLDRDISLALELLSNKTIG